MFMLQLPFVDGKSSEEMKKTSNVVLMVRKRMYDISQHNFVQNFILPLLLHSTIITYVILAVLNWYKRSKFHRIYGMPIKKGLFFILYNVYSFFI